MARTTTDELFNSLRLMGNAARLPIIPRDGSSYKAGALTLSHSPAGWRLVQFERGHNGEPSAERDLSPRMSAGEMKRALDFAADLFRMKADTVDIN